MAAPAPDPPRRKIQVRQKLGEVKAWEEEREVAGRKPPARIVVLSEDPDGLTGINQAKYAKGYAGPTKSSPYIDARENREQWCIASRAGRQMGKEGLSRSCPRAARWKSSGRSSFLLPPLEGDPERTGGCTALSSRPARTGSTPWA